jgi:hypothetical protein
MSSPSTYDLSHVGVKQYDVLDRHAKMLQKMSREQISVADVIRESIDIYIDAIEETNGNDSR